MRISKFLHCSTLTALCICGTAWAAPEASWPVPPKLIELPTPYGTLAVGPSDYIYESKLELDGTLLEPQISGMLNIHYAFEMPDAQAALISISRGNETCPISYRWVVLRADGYKVSPEFGSCSPQIRVSADSSQLTLQTPNAQSPDTLDVYVYDGATVKQSTSKKKRQAKQH